MADEPTHNTSIVSIAGKNNDHLHILANLYYEPFDPESVLSVVASLNHKPDVKWQNIYSTETWCTSMDQSEGGALYVVSMEGEMHILQNSQCDMINFDCPDGLNAVWAANDNEAYAVGLKGEIIHVIGRKKAAFKDPQGRRLNAIHGCSKSEIWAVGDNGVIYRFDGNDWKEIKSPTNINILTVLCESETEVYIGGARGTLAVWNGTEWQFLSSPEVNISSLSIYEHQLYAATGKNGVHLLYQNDLKLFKELVLYRLKTIDDRLFGVANKLVA